jgi:hypothetical protein
MSEERYSEVQLCLFQSRLVWHEFPKDTRQQICELLGFMCIEILDVELTSEQETRDESASHSPLAP